MASNRNSRSKFFQEMKRCSPARQPRGITLSALLILVFERVHQLGHCLFKLHILRL
jgi:hypothetical protein